MKMHELIAEYYPQYHNVMHYPANKCACIRGTKDEWGILSNFYYAPLIVKNITFDCTERLYHLMKFCPTATEGILSEYAAKRGMAIKHHIKHINKEHPEWLRPDWGKMIVDAMKFCLVTKYNQCSKFRDALEQSNNMFIVEDETNRNARRHSNADSWGVNLVGDEYVGPNLLGRLLMELRDKHTLEYTLPDDALLFISAISTPLKPYNATMQ